jgi:hypothetical protein
MRSGRRPVKDALGVEPRHGTATAAMASEEGAL